jgi:cytochrome c-type biogenesis protein
MTLSILAIFGAGLLTFASPCVLPLMPIYLATIAGGSLEAARPHRTLLLAAAFSAGLSLVFILLGAFASSLGGALLPHRTMLVAVSGALMVAFGLRALGVLRMRALDVDARPALHRVEAVSSVASAFVFGAAFALGWSPCIGPVLASVLSYAATNTQSPWQGAGYLAIYAGGLSAPLLLLAAAASRATAWLRRSRSAIPRLEKLTGGAMLALGAWTLVALAWPSLSEAPRAARTAPPADSQTSCDGDGDPSHGCALPQLPQLHGFVDVIGAADVRGAHILEFTAEDCPVCRRMRPVIDRLVAACRELDTRIVRVDVATPQGRALADHHGVRGTPTFLLIDEAGRELNRLLGERTREDVAAAVEATLGISCWG